MNLKKIIAVSALSAVLGVSTLSQAVSVNAEVAETGVYCSNGMSGITVYAYEHFGLELGTMHLYVKGRTAYNEFRTSRYCSPYVELVLIDITFLILVVPIFIREQGKW
jgi:hypothetical protein